MKSNDISLNLYQYPPPSLPRAKKETHHIKASFASTFRFTGMMLVYITIYKSPQLLRYSGCCSFFGIVSMIYKV